ncbi:MAG: glycosyltransferase family 2 protein [Puniceicoccales bacterium]|jgi:glycosyltransferase involved in cell wall biosynthesis|nr:glycosyltransferase family 2 protein [Puniceicoccales bacterium]
MNNKLPISIVLIASNEEKNIARCLKSVYTWVEEIIVVVNDCTDRTVEIAESYGATVVEHPWQNFRDQKNFAKQLATKEWILSIDADEVVSDELRSSILMFVVNNDRRYNGAFFKRLVFFLGKWIHHGDWYPDHCQRLFRRDCGYWSGGLVHEYLKVSGNVKSLNGNLLHYTYDSVKEHVEVMIKYTDLFIEDNKDKPVNLLTAAFRSVWKFFRCYIIKLGFLDGIQGIYIAMAQGFFTLYKYIHLTEYQNAKIKQRLINQHSDDQQDPNQDSMK